MANRFMMFIDGANLKGISDSLGVKIDSHTKLIGNLFRASVSNWKRSFFSPDNIDEAARFVRAYFFSVGSMDEWDLNDPTSIRTLRNLFDRHQKTSSVWMAAAQQSAGITEQIPIIERAWQLYFAETARWYESKLAAFDGVGRFLYALESRPDFIEINRDGHWKLDMLSHTAEEKAVDTGLSVTMATMTSSYDVALLISGDYDALPAVRHVKKQGKQVGIVQFVQSDSDNQRGYNLSKAMRREADFVVSVSDTDLIESGVASARPGVPGR